MIPDCVLNVLILCQSNQVVGQFCAVALSSVVMNVVVDGPKNFLEKKDGQNMTPCPEYAVQVPLKKNIYIYIYIKGGRGDRTKGKEAGESEKSGEGGRKRKVGERRKERKEERDPSLSSLFHTHTLSFFLSHSLFIIGPDTDSIVVDKV